MKQRTHNEWFRTISGKKCDCGMSPVQLYSWGEYVHGKWRTVLHFCEHCFRSRVHDRLLAHKHECGCSFQLVYKSGTKPWWLKIEEYGTNVCVEGARDGS